MKTIAENGDYQLIYAPDLVNRYAVYLTTSYTQPSGLKLKIMVARSPIFSKKLKSYFTPAQVQTAIAKVHAMNYANKKFKV